MRILTEEDLKAFQRALIEDYGLKLDGEELRETAWNLLQFTEALIKFDREDKDKKNS